jgi:hypothetical protein
MQERNVDSLSITTYFYGYDGDGLVGFVNGQVVDLQQ